MGRNLDSSDILMSNMQLEKTFEEVFLDYRTFLSMTKMSFF
jgi:hypothetical protein